MLPTYGARLVRHDSSASCFAVSIALFFLALIVFGRLEGNFAEEL